MMPSKSHGRLYDVTTCMSSCGNQARSQGTNTLWHEEYCCAWDNPISSLIIVGAVATDVPHCSEMAAGILERNGSAVDAAITALLCVGVVHAESSGIGGYVCFIIDGNWG